MKHRIIKKELDKVYSQIHTFSYNLLVLRIVAKLHCMATLCQSNLSIVNRSLIGYTSGLIRGVLIKERCPD